MPTMATKLSDIPQDVAALVAGLHKLGVQTV